MTRARLQSLAERWMTFWQGAGLAAFDEVHAETFVDHGAGERQGTRAAFKQSVAQLYEAFPDFHATTQAMAIDETGNKVAIAWSATGTHRGLFLDEPASGARVAFRGVELIACDGGKIVARWGEWDGLAILHQIRAAATP